jgi:hypothetical protein
LARIEGTEFWAAQLEDERYLPEIARQLEQRKRDRKKDEAPPLRGYSRLVAVMEDLIDQIHLLRAESGRWGSSAVRLRTRPEFPADKLAKQRTQWHQGHVNDLLAQARAMKERGGETP